MLHPRRTKTKASVLCYHEFERGGRGGGRRRKREREREKEREREREREREKRYDTYTLVNEKWKLVMKHDGTKQNYNSKTMVSWPKSSACGQK